MLYSKKLDEKALLPTVAHPNEDLGYDIYSLETIALNPYAVTKVRTGIAVRFIDDFKHYKYLGGSEVHEKNYGLLVRDRSSMAGKGLAIVGGVIDAGYTGELVVMFHNTTSGVYIINSSDKIAQIIPMEVNTTGGVQEVTELPESSRGDKGFGSSGK